MQVQLPASGRIFLYQETTLCAGAVLRLRAVPGAQIRCDTSDLWITQENGPQDIFVARGQAFQILDDGLTLAQANEPARVAVLGDLTVSRASSIVRADARGEEHVLFGHAPRAQRLVRWVRDLGAWGTALIAAGRAR